MKIFSLFLLFFTVNTQSNLITPKKLCKNCKHYIFHKKQCAIFGEIDLVSGKNNYDYAIFSRKNESKCGEDAKYFEDNTNKFETIPYYFITNVIKCLPVFPNFL
jgi:hypothetical protein